MDEKKHKSFDLSLLEDRKTVIMSSTEAFEDVTPFNWSEDVINGKTKVFYECEK